MLVFEIIRELNEGLNLDQRRGENLRENAFKEKLKVVFHSIFCSAFYRLFRRSGIFPYLWK